MAKIPRVYTRLTRAIAGVGTYKSLWLAADHLMVVNSTGYTEDYSRLRFRDIKGFFVIDSDRRLWWGFAWGIWTLISVLPFIRTLAAKETPLFSAGFLVLGLGGLIWNHLLGRGCRAFVVTGVQTAVLPSVVRWTKARKLLNKLEPLILGTQFDLVPVPAIETAPPLPSVPPPPLP